MSTTLWSLTQTLLDGGVDVSKFGVNQAKSLEQLLTEIQEGESFLTTDDDGLYRNITALSIVLRRIDDGRVLIESSQHFHATRNRDPYSRSRSSPLAEKLGDGEGVKDGVRRALKEELGIKHGYKIISIVRRIEVRSSASYPGLMTKYTFYDVLVDAALPEEYKGDVFSYTEYFEDGTPRVTAHWAWVSIDSIKENKYKDYVSSLTSLGL